MYIITSQFTETKMFVTEYLRKVNFHEIFKKGH